MQLCRLETSAVLEIADLGLTGAGVLVVEVADVLVPLLAAEAPTGDPAGPLCGVIAQGKQPSEVEHGDGPLPAADREHPTARKED